MISRSPSRKGRRLSGSEPRFLEDGLMFDPALSTKRSSADTEERDQPTPAPARTTMNVSPLDLRQQRFRHAIRGFDKVEVTSFLLAVADDYEQALRETSRLRL